MLLENILIYTKYISFLVNESWSYATGLIPPASPSSIIVCIFFPARAERGNCAQLQRGFTTPTESRQSTTYQ